MDDEDATEWVIIHYRAVGGGLIFGSFSTLEEAIAWGKEHPDVNGGIYPMHLTVDWNRKGVI